MRSMRLPILGLHALLLGLLSLLSCAPAHVIDYREAVSRDWTTVAFTRNTKNYRHRSQVGGEHISTVQVLGFRGDVFRIKLASRGDPVMFTIFGDGIRTVDTGQQNDKDALVVVEALETIVKIELSAHPYGAYELTIEPIQP